MTKKSLARQQRDAQAKEDDLIEKSLRGNTGWDDLTGIYNTCMTGILGLEATLLNAYKAEGPKRFLRKEHFPRIKISLAGIDADFRLLKTELAEIYAKHSDKTGKAADINEFANCMGHFENYQAWKVRAENLIRPTYDFLSIEIGIATDAWRLYEQKVAEANSRDPEVITDALAKDIAQQLDNDPTIAPSPAPETQV